MKHQPEIRSHDAVTLVVVTWLCLRSYWWLSIKTGKLMEVVSAEGLLKLALWLPTCLLVLWLIYRRDGRSALGELGLGPGLMRGLLLGLTATAPMLFAVVALPKSPLDPDLVLGSAIIGPFAEEVLFRGFLFRQLVRRAGWSLPVAILVSSILFGLAHVRSFDVDLWTMLRGPDPMHFEAVSRDGSLVRFTSGYEVWWRYLSTRLPVILSYGLPYAAGGAVFAWIAHRWNSLWPAIALHGFMNFWWDLTKGEHGRLEFTLDPLSAAQALSVALAIGLTLRWARRAGDG